MFLSHVYLNMRSENCHIIINMSHFGLRVNKSQKPDSTPYTIYYPHLKPHTARNWTEEYLQIISIDPGRNNYAFRIERRWHNGQVTPVVFDKESFPPSKIEGDTTTCYVYQGLTQFLNKYKEFYDGCHYIIIERQLPQNYKATRIAQHTITYFSLFLADKPLLPAIVEVSPQLKGKILGAPKGISDKQLKTWAVEEARRILQIRQDHFSLGVLNKFATKQDDLSDTVCQAEALFIAWGYPPTQLSPTAPIVPSVTSTIPTTMVNLAEAPVVSGAVQRQNLITLTQTAPARMPSIPTKSPGPALVLKVASQ